MKFSSFFLGLVCFVLSLISCKKDSLDPTPINSGKSTHSAFITQNNWTQREKQFFNIENAPNINLTSSRSDSNIDSLASTFAYHPLLIQAYNKLVQQNEAHSFAEGMVNKAGIPIWKESYVYKDGYKNLLLIPLSFPQQQKITGFISIVQNSTSDNSTFIINGVSRDNLLDTLTGNAHQKASYLNWLVKYEKKLYNTTDENTESILCRHRRVANLTPPPSNGTTTNIFNGCSDTPSNCDWKTIEVCWNNDLQVHWFGGINNIPPHLDHDRDGVLNEYDNDFLFLGITQQEFENRVRDWWEENYEDEYDMDYDEFWTEVYSNGEGSEIDFTKLNDAWGDFWHNFENFFDDLWGDVGDWWNGIWDPIGCPFDDPLLGNGTNNRNETTCEWFYVLDCGTASGSDNSWWDDFSEVKPCPECPGYQEYQNMHRDRLHDHWKSNYTNSTINAPVEFWDLYNLSQHCDPYSPCFEQCVDEAFINSYFYVAPPPETPFLFPNDVESCFINQSECTNCFYRAVLYIEQPVPGTREIFDYDGSGSSGSGKNNGHTFMSLEQYDPAVSLIDPVRVVTFGFYPADKPHGQEIVAGHFYKENINTRHNISVTYDITNSQLESLIDYLSDLPNQYQVGYQNCSTNMVYALQHVGFFIPITPRWVPIFGEI